MTVVSIPMSAALKKDIQEIAALNNRKAAAWVRLQLQALVRRSKAARKSARTGA